MDQQRKSLKDSISAPGLILSLLGMFVLFNLYGAPNVRDAAHKNEFLAESELAQSILEVLTKAGEATGLAALREGSAAIRRPVNEAYTVLQKPEEPLPELPPVKTATKAQPPPKPTSDGIVHHAAPTKSRILVIGASSIQFAIGVEFEKRLPNYPGVKVKRFGKLATGLSRPDFMDWPKKARELTLKFRPDLVITNFGGNDAQGIARKGKGKAKYGTSDWDEAYAGKVTEIVDIGKAVGADTVMMGMPVMRSKRFSAKMRRLNKVKKKAVESVGATFVSTYEMAALEDRKSYRKTISYRGKRGLMRTSDGVHYTKLGAKYVVEQVMQQVERTYRIVPDNKKRAVCEPHAFTSPRTNEEGINYWAYLPRDARKQPNKLDLLLLAPGKKDDFDTWPRHPHRTLQKLAEKHQVALVLLPEDALQADTTWLPDLLKDLRKHLPVSERWSLVAAVETPLPKTLPESFQRLSLIGPAPEALPPAAVSHPRIGKTQAWPWKALFTPPTEQ